MNFCSIFSKDTQPFDFIKSNTIHVLAYKLKYSQIYGSLIMFLEIQEYIYIYIYIYKI